MAVCTELRDLEENQGLLSCDGVLRSVQKEAKIIRTKVP
jgi:hypothetical protein